MPPLFSYEIVRLLRRFAKGPCEKIELPILAQAADEIEGLRVLLRECKPFLSDADGALIAPKDLCERINAEVEE
jgi:hypothetical protein